MSKHRATVVWKHCLVAGRNTGAGPGSMCTAFCLDRLGWEGEREMRKERAREMGGWGTTATVTNRKSNGNNNDSNTNSNCNNTVITLLSYCYNVTMIIITMGWGGGGSEQVKRKWKHDPWETAKWVSPRTQEKIRGYYALMTGWNRRRGRVGEKSEVHHGKSFRSLSL